MFVIIQTAVADKKEAKTLSKLMLEKKLVACVQMTKIESSYVWKGEICDVKEYLLSIKTTQKNLDAVQKFLTQNHSYEINEFTAFKVTHSKEYEEWVERSVKE